MLLKACQVVPAQPGAMWGPVPRCQRSGGHNPSLAGLGTCGSEGCGLWFPQLWQSMLNKLNKMCVGGESTKEKLQENPACSPSCQVQRKLQLPKGCVHCHILLRPRGHTANQCHHRPLAQHPCGLPGHGQPLPGTAPRRGEGSHGQGPWADSEVASDRLL